MMALAAFTLAIGNAKAALNDSLEISDLRYASLGYTRESEVNPVIYHKDQYHSIHETFENGRVRWIVYFFTGGDLSFTQITRLLAENHLPPLDSDFWAPNPRHISNMIQWFSQDRFSQGIKFSVTISYDVRSSNPDHIEVAAIQWPMQ
jgi:hypothetical protein